MGSKHRTKLFLLHVARSSSNGDANAGKPKDTLILILRMKNNILCLVLHPNSIYYCNIYLRYREAGQPAVQGIPSFNELETFSSPQNGNSLSQPRPTQPLLAPAYLALRLIAPSYY